MNFSVQALISLIVWIKENMEPYNEKHKQFVQSLATIFTNLLKPFEKPLEISENYSMLVFKLCYAIANTFPGQLKRNIKKIKNAVLEKILRNDSSESCKLLAIKVLVKLCNCGTNLKEEAKFLFNDTLNSIQILINLQKPRKINENVEFDQSIFHTILFEIHNKESMPSKITLKHETNCYVALAKLRNFLMILRQILTKSSENAILYLDLGKSIKTLIEILKIKHQNPNITGEYVNGMQSQDFNYFLDLAKCEIIGFLAEFISQFGQNLYSFLSYLLKSIREIYSISENNQPNSEIFISLLQLLKIILSQYGASCYDLITEILFVCEPNIFKNLLSSFRDLIERYDNSVIKKDAKFFMSAEFRGSRKQEKRIAQKKKKVENIAELAGIEIIETNLLEKKICVMCEVIQKYISECQLLILKENRASIENTIFSILDLSYIYTFAEFPDNIKITILDCAYNLIKYPSNLGIHYTKETHRFASVFLNYVQKARSNELFSNSIIHEKLNFYISALNLQVSETTITGPGRRFQEGEIISYREMILQQNKKLVESVIGSNKQISKEIQTNPIEIKEEIKIPEQKIEPLPSQAQPEILQIPKIPEKNEEIKKIVPQAEIIEKKPSEIKMVSEIKKEEKVEIISESEENSEIQMPEIKFD